MKSSKVIHALYTDDDVLLNAVKKLRAAKHAIEEVYTPFPVHGLDKAHGSCTNTNCHYFIHVWLCRSLRGNFDDELYHDPRLASGHWRKAKF